MENLYYVLILLPLTLRIPLYLYDGENRKGEERWREVQRRDSHYCKDSEKFHDLSATETENAGDQHNSV